MWEDACEYARSRAYSLAEFAMSFDRSPDYRERLFKLVAFLLRYGPKSIDELLRLPVWFLNELAAQIGEIMDQERAIFDSNLLTGDS